MRTWYYLFFGLFFTMTANSQHIYVKSWQESEGGWIVSPEGETLYEIPAGWRPESHNAPMAEIEAWPILLLWQKSGENSRYAFVTSALQWQPINDYKAVVTLGHNRFKGLLPNAKEVVLLDSKGKSVSTDTLRNIEPFDEYSTAIGTINIDSKKARSGLLDTMGQWIISPGFSRLHGMGHNRYLGYDSLDNQYLLTLNRTAAKWDTLIDFSQNEWLISHIWQYDETGLTWLRQEPDLYRLINLEGQFVGDTVSGQQIRPFSEGIGMIGDKRGYCYINENGKHLNDIYYPSAVNFAEGLALVEDPHSGYLGYLNREGVWAIEPDYCYATSFRNGCAVVAPAIAKNCSTLVRGRGGDRHIPASLNHTRVVRAYQLINTEGKIIWADSCRELYLPAVGVLGINYSYNQLSPGMAIKWLNENRIWLSPNFTVTRWAQLDSLSAHTIRRINLGARRFELLYDQLFELPDNFSDRLATAELQQLEELNIGSHRLTPKALEAVFNLPQLRSLSLSYSDLTILPAAIKQLGQLEILDLSGTQLTSLPKAIYRMRHLRKIIIINTALPAETIPLLRKALPDTEIVFKNQW